MKLVAYQLDARPMDIRPAPLKREWMEASNQRFAYRCLPLNIANGHGRELLSSVGGEASLRRTRRCMGITRAASAQPLFSSNRRRWIMASTRLRACSLRANRPARSPLSCSWLCRRLRFSSVIRIFDQLKPWPARWAERLGGGAGIVLDDVAAGVWGAAVLLAGRALGWL